MALFILPQRCRSLSAQIAHTHADLFVNVYTHIQGGMVKIKGQDSVRSAQLIAEQRSK